MEPSRILVLRGGALGDFIVTLPLLASLRERWPAAHIALVGNAAAAELARARGLLDAVHAQHAARWSPLFSAAPLAPPLAAWLADFDLVLNYWPDPDGDLRGHFPARAGQVFLHADAMPGCAPAARHYCEPLRDLGVVARQFWYPLTKDAGRRAGIAVHPGSGSRRKNWAEAHWRALLRQLPEPVSLVIGEAEAETWSRGDPGMPMLRQRPLEELVAHFARCRLFVGHDSGISHLAAACGAPCVLLFGPTEPTIWAPPAPNVRVLRRGPDVNSISVPEVRAAVAAALADRT